MGDLPGHPFRGNQWGRGGARASEGGGSAAKTDSGDYKTRGGAGSAPTSDGNPTGQFDAESERGLAARESAIQGQDFESAHVLDAQGRVLFEKDGGKSEIKFTSEECALMRGAVITHNHPRSRPLSDDDVQLAVEQGLREVRAVGRDGTLFRLGSTKGWKEEHWDSYQQIRAGSMAKVNGAIRRGDLTSEEANARWGDQLHGIMMEFARRNASDGVYYKRTRR